MQNAKPEPVQALVPAKRKLINIKISKEGVDELNSHPTPFLLLNTKKWQQQLYQLLM